MLQDLTFGDRRVPYPLINATINLPGSSDLTLHARGADFFLYSPLYCGSAVTGSYSTGGAWTRPSLPRMPSTRRSRSALTKWPSTGPVERV